MKYCHKWLIITIRSNYYEEQITKCVAPLPNTYKHTGVGPSPRNNYIYRCWDDKILYLKCWRNFFFPHIFVARESDFVLTKFCTSICKLKMSYISCNLVLIVMNVFMLSWKFHIFWDTRFYHFSNDILPSPVFNSMTSRNKILTLFNKFVQITLNHIFCIHIEQKKREHS